MGDGTGIPAIDAAVVWSAVAVAIATGVGLLWRVTRRIKRAANRVEEFVDDWTGEPARPGVEARPGVMERLGGMEQRLGGIERCGADTARRVERIEHELHPNSGTSVRDALDRVEAALSPPA
jgi:hypothetical protein